jgi:hypothetical protein
MWSVLSFWFLLGLPGLAFLQRLDPQSLERGALSAIGRAYVASFVLLTPFSVLGFLTGAPLWMLSAAVVALAVAAIAVLAWDRRWLRLFRSPCLAAAVCGIWLAFDLWIAASVGSHTSGDAGYHVARIRLLAEFGFNNWDPLLSGKHFESVYHTNLYHAVIAACAQLARVDVGVAWIWTWPVLKLLVAAGLYELAVAVFGASFCGYLAALCGGLCLVTTSTLAFPNTLATYALLPFGLACAVDAAAESPRPRHALWLAAATLVLVQTHLLYALFLALAAVPMLVVRLIAALLRRSPRRRTLALAVLATAIALPWFWPQAAPRLEAFWKTHRASLGSFVSVASAQAAPARRPHVSERAHGRFIHLDERQLRLDPRPFLDSTEPHMHAVAVTLLVAVCSRRRQAFALLGIVATACAWILTPTLCSLLVNLLGNWVVLRFTKVFVLISVALLPGALPFLIGRALAGARRAHPHLLQAVLALAGVFTAVAYAGAQGSYYEPWTKEATWSAARDFAARDKAELVTQRAKFFAAHIARDATVMAALMRDYDLPMHCACRVLAYRRGRGERGQSDLGEKRDAIERFFAADTSADAKLELLRKYGVRYVYTSPGRAARLARSFGSNTSGIVWEKGDAIVKLRE